MIDKISGSVYPSGDFEYHAGGEFCKSSDVEPILNSLQQLKAEILPLLYDARQAVEERSSKRILFAILEIESKLSAV